MVLFMASPASSKPAICFSFSTLGSSRCAMHHEWILFISFAANCSAQIGYKLSLLLFQVSFHKRLHPDLLHRYVLCEVHHRRQTSLPESSNPAAMQIGVVHLQFPKLPRFCPYDCEFCDISVCCVFQKSFRAQDLHAACLDIRYIDL